MGDATPPGENGALEHPQLARLIATLAQLRAPGGCAWDREQTHGSLVRYLIEESHELVDAIESGSRDELIEELGDVLYQVIFHSDIAAHAEREEDRFDLEDVAAQMTAKMIARHPHVFGNLSAASSDEVVAIWDEVKGIEKSHRTSVLDGIPAGMPSLLLAEKLIGKAEKVGVVPGRVDSADVEFTEADEGELGRRLMGIVAAARRAGLDAERALRTAIRDLSSEVRQAESRASAAVDEAAGGEAARANALP